MVNWSNTFHEIETAKPEIALLPVGAIEQHSYHLPVGTDYLIAQALSRLIADRLDDCYLLPALPFSCSREHGDFGGTVWMRPATLAAVIEDLVGALHHQGIEKIALVVAHGGNWIVKPTVREINLERRGVHVIFSGPPSAEGGEFTDLHAGQTETSIMLHLHPEMVKQEQAKEDYSPTQGREFLDYVGVAGVSPTGVWGAPSKGTAEEGAELLERAAQQAADYIRRTFAEIERLEQDRQRRQGG